MPVPKSAQTSERFRRQPQRNTVPELKLRRALHRRGLRYRVDRAPISGMRSRADIVFGPSRVAVFVDGCFWHGCPVHSTKPSHNAAWWHEKIASNRRRDARVNAALAAEGWVVVRVWEHEDPETAAGRIAELVRQRRSSSELAKVASPWERS